KLHGAPSKCIDMGFRIVVITVICLLTISYSKPAQETVATADSVAVPSPTLESTDGRTLVTLKTQLFC
ncbi:MAG TPA: hypothetical protein VF473_08920, partial [Cyclobacteriaceae bacterium]